MTKYDNFVEQTEVFHWECKDKELSLVVCILFFM